MAKPYYPPPPGQAPAPTYGYAQPQPVMAQPVMQQPAMVIMQNAGLGFWKASLFECQSDCGLCMASCFLPCCVHGSNANMRRDARFIGPMEGCNGECICYALGCYARPLYAICGMSGRGNHRAKYNIAGGCCGDCCTHLCCYSCAVGQEYLDLKKRLEPPQQGMMGGVMMSQPGAVFMR